MECLPNLSLDQCPALCTYASPAPAFAIDSQCSSVLLLLPHDRIARSLSRRVPRSLSSSALFVFACALLALLVPMTVSGHSSLALVVADGPPAAPVILIFRLSVACEPNDHSTRASICATLIPMPDARVAWDIWMSLSHYFSSQFSP